MTAVTRRPTTRSSNYHQDQEYLETQRETNPFTNALRKDDKMYSAVQQELAVVDTDLADRVNQEFIAWNDEQKRAAEYEKASKKHVLIRNVTCVALTAFVAYVCYDFAVGYKEDVSEGYEYGKWIIDETVRNISSIKNLFGIISIDGKTIVSNFFETFGNCSLKP